MGCLIKSQRDFKILRIVFRHHRKGHFGKKKTHKLQSSLEFEAKGEDALYVTRWLTVNVKACSVCDAL